MPTKELAQVVFPELDKRFINVPSESVIKDICDALYFVSLMTEEGQSIQVHVVYLDPKQADDNQSGQEQSPPEDSWSFVPFSDPISLTNSNFAKLAKASDPRTSSFVIYPDSRRKLCIWGLIDQQNRYYEFVNFDTDTGPNPPGLFHASILGVGHISVNIKYDKIAELKVDRLVQNTRDVLRKGPVHQALQLGIRNYLRTCKSTMPKEIRNNPSYEWEKIFEYEWISGLCRLLLRIQSYRHGGALLLTPDTSFQHLNISYNIDYPRLMEALESRAQQLAHKAHISDIIWQMWLAPETNELPFSLYAQEHEVRVDMEENRSELHGALWFISLLSRVDGLVLMTPELRVKGFGVEITTQKEPTKIFRSRRQGAAQRDLQIVDYNHFGTRHRSMMRYCAQTPGSIGFVISQDGEVRVMTKVRGNLIVWENPRLQYHDFIPRPKRPKKRR